MKSRRDKSSETGNDHYATPVRAGGWSALKAALDPSLSSHPLVLGSASSEPSEVWSVLDGLVDAITVIGRDYRIAYFNSSTHKYLRISPEEAQGQVCFHAFLDHGSECHSGADCPVHKVVESRQTFHTSKSCLSQQGESIVIDVSAWPLLDDGGEVAQVVLVQRDVTEVTRMQQQLARMEEVEDQKTREASALKAVARAADETPDLRSVLTTACQKVLEVLRCDRCIVLLLDQSRGELIPVASSMPTAGLIESARPVSVEGEEKVWQFVLGRRRVLALDALGEATITAGEGLPGSGVKSVMVAPLLAQGNPLGILYVDCLSHSRKWKDEEKSVVGLLADQIALAIDNSNAYERATRRTAQLMALNELSRSVSSCLDLNEVARSLALNLPGIVGFDRAGLALLDDAGTGWETYDLGGSDTSKVPWADRLAANTAIAGVLENKDLWISRDLARETRFGEDESLAAEGIRSRVVVPLVAKNRVVGILNLESGSPNTYARGDLQILKLIASQVTAAVENAILFEVERRRSQEVSALHVLALDISKTLDEGVVVRAALDRISQIAHSQLCAVLYLGSDNLDSGRRELYVCSSKGDGTWIAPLLEGYENDKGSVLADALEGTVFIPDLSAYQAMMGVSASDSPPTSMAATPIWANKVVQGVLLLISGPGKGYKPREVELFEAISNQIGIGIERSRLHEEVSLLAVTDGLTELHTHRYFYQRLAEEFKRARAFDRPLCMLFIDVDNLRTVNEVHGHLVGDRVLRELSHLIKQSVRGTDIVARYGGDELTVILPESSEQQAKMLAERLQSAVSQAQLLDSDTPGAVTVSIGIARLTPDLPDEAQLVSRADQAAYRAKRMGRNALVVYGRD